MTTDKEALQKIFDAALRQASEEEAAEASRRRQQQAPVRRMHCQVAKPSVADAIAAAAAAADMEPETDIANHRGIPAQTRSAPSVSEDEGVQAQVAVAEPAVAELDVAEPIVAESTPQPETASVPVLDHDASTELADIFEQKMAVQARQHKSGRLMAVAALIAAIGAGIIWFTQSADRVKQLESTIRDIKSTGDANQMVGSHEDSLNKIASHAEQVNAATMEMGASTELKEDKDADLPDEMKTMMGGEGNATSDRTRAMHNAFGGTATRQPDNSGTPASNR